MALFPHSIRRIGKSRFSKASAIHIGRELIATVRPLIRVGNTSDMNTHFIGPIEKAKHATKVAAAVILIVPDESTRPTRCL